MGLREVLSRSCLDKEASLSLVPFCVSWLYGPRVPDQVMAFLFLSSFRSDIQSFCRIGVSGS